MDLNELLKRHQIELIGVRHASTPALRADACDRARGFAGRIAQLRPGLVPASCRHAGPALAS